MKNKMDELEVGQSEPIPSMGPGAQTRDLGDFADFDQTLRSPERSRGAISQFCQSEPSEYVSSQGFAAQNEPRGPHEATKNKMDELEVGQLASAECDPHCSRPLEFH